MKHTRVIGATCIQCHTVVDGVTDPHGDGMPEPGHYSLCLYCGALMVFDTTTVAGQAINEETLSLRLRAPTAAEHAVFDADAGAVRSREIILQRIRDQVEQQHRVRVYIVPPERSADVLAWLRETLQARRADGESRMSDPRAE